VAWPVLPDAALVVPFLGDSGRDRRLLVEVAGREQGGGSGECIALGPGSGVDTAPSSYGSVKRIGVARPVRPSVIAFKPSMRQEDGPLSARFHDEGYSYWFASAVFVDLAQYDVEDLCFEWG
jgi:hypothetical protein